MAFSKFVPKISEPDFFDVQFEMLELKYLFTSASDYLRSVVYCSSIFLLLGDDSALNARNPS